MNSTQPPSTDELSSSPSLPLAPILSHVTVLRRAIIRYIIVLGAGFGLAMGFHSELIYVLQYPLRLMNYPLELGFIEVTEPFMVSIRVACLSAFIVSSPFLCYEIWRFVSPGLYLMERRHVLSLMLASWLLFTLGVTVCFLLVLPITLDFLVNYGSDFAAPTLTLSSYVSFLSMLIVGFGLVFELPLVLFILALMELITASDLKHARRYVLLGSFVCSAFLTPPDWISQVAMAVPIYLLYEIAIVIVGRLEKHRRT